MAQVINTNVASLFAGAALNKSANALQAAQQRLSSGLRINSAKDDSTGLATATSYDTQIRGANVQIRNANDGISTAQTNDGYLGQITENLQRMPEILSAATPAGNAETAALIAENTRIQCDSYRLAAPALTAVPMLPADTAANARYRSWCDRHCPRSVRRHHGDGSFQGRHPASCRGEPVGRLQPHHGYRLRRRNHQHDPQPDSATSGYRGPGAVEPEPAAWCCRSCVNHWTDSIEARPV